MKKALAAQLCRALLSDCSVAATTWCGKTAAAGGTGVANLRLWLRRAIDPGRPDGPPHGLLGLGEVVQSLVHRNDRAAGCGGTHNVASQEVHLRWAAAVHVLVVTARQRA